MKTTPQSGRSICSCWTYWVAMAVLGLLAPATADEMWISQIPHGESPFHASPDSYQIYRNVLDFGCVGDGVTDDTDCINAAISLGSRCASNCGTSTLTPAIVYFPSGTYLISAPLVMHFFTQMIGNANDPPILVAAPNFQGLALLESNPREPDGENWYTPNNNFFRQVRNFKLDLTRRPASVKTTGIHWQVSQGTSLYRLTFNMSKDPESTHEGIFMENGAGGGFMSDLHFEGGAVGMQVGNQHFLSKNMVFNDCKTGISLNWDWQWTFKSLTFNRVGIALDMSEAGGGDGVTPHGVGSIVMSDSSLIDTPVGIKTHVAFPALDMSGSILLDNIRLQNVTAVVATRAGAVVLPGAGSGTGTVDRWGRGSLYTDDSGVGHFFMGALPPIDKSDVLLDAQGSFFERSRPQYEELSATDFANVRDYGALGNGRSDDTIAIQLALNDNAGPGGKVVYFPHGVYIVSNTVTVHPGTRIIGELWSMLMAYGPNFMDDANPRPMVRVGAPGSVGDVEITDMMFTTRGGAPGAILVEWNIRASSPGSAGMWDSQLLVGAYEGSELGPSNCPKDAPFTPLCTAVFMQMHVTASGSGLFENLWVWTGDHDLDTAEQGWFTIYGGRGLLIESADGPVWVYGVHSEHNIFYQYQVSNARNVYMTLLQAEPPYWQPFLPAPAPFYPNAAYSDPTYYHCTGPGSAEGCPVAYALRVLDSSDVYLYGAGFYNFFSNYDSSCLATLNCQESMIGLERVQKFYGFNINSLAATNIIVENNTVPLAVQADNSNNFCQTINAFLIT